MPVNQINTEYNFAYSTKQLQLEHMQSVTHVCDTWSKTDLMHLSFSSLYLQHCAAIKVQLTWNVLAANSDQRVEEGVL